MAERVQKFTSDGTFVTKWGTRGSGDGQFYTLTGITVDSAGNVYITDRNNERIQKFTSNGTFVTKWGTMGSEDYLSYFPQDIAVDSVGNVYVTGYSSNYYLKDRVRKFTSTGAFITEWGGNGGADGKFVDIGGIAVDGVDNVYVADSGNKRVQKFTSSGTYVSTLDVPYSYPHYITVDSTGNVYISVSGRIMIFTGQGGTPAPTTTPTVSPVKQVPGGSAVPHALNNDGLYKDVNGNGAIDFNDVVLFFNNMDWIATNEPVSAFDFNKNGQIDFNDVVILFNEM
ncbi:SBBP repeat-containing protein [Methanosphaerula subterraneus]|uniref:SBBP repeat-containing protein n=1 Tax=Methanosphaerula subterraneus TaxID=3350244 RepID=UPI003F8277C7